MGFSGRCEAIKAPTTENDTVSVRRVAIVGPYQAKKISPRVRTLRRARIRLAVASATATPEHSRCEAFPSHRTDSRVGRELLPDQLGTDAHDGGTPPLVGCHR